MMIELQFFSGSNDASASLHVSAAKGVDTVGISQESFYTSMMVYQWATEREVVRRITGASGVMIGKFCFASLKKLAVDFASS